MIKDKIIPFDKVSSHIAGLRSSKPDSVIVLCHGCFDIVHPGHIRHLRFAKEQGSFLVVSITPDICIQKGSNRPLMPQDLRCENLAALEIIDAVTVAPGETGIEPIESIRPDIYVKGSEYAVSRDPRFLKEKDRVEQQGGRVVYSSGDVVFSSTEIIREHDMDLAIDEKLNYICKRYKITRELLSGRLQAASGVELLVVGESVLDERLYCDGLGIAQESPVLSISLKHKALSVGGAGSIALHLAAIGAKVSLLTSVQASGQGYEFFKLSLDEAGVSMTNIDDKYRQICVKTHCFVDSNQVLEIEKAPHKTLDSTMRMMIAKEFKKLLKPNLKCVILSDFGYGLLSDDLVETMVDLSASKGCLSVADITMTPRTNLDKFGKADILTVTEAELRACLHDYESGLSVLVDKFYRRSKVNELFLMLSDGGAIFFRRPKSFAKYQNMESVHIPQLSPKREGRTGLPEAFTAGIAFARASGLEQEASVYMAAAFSASHSRVTSPGKPMDPERLRRLLEEHKELA